MAYGSNAVDLPHFNFFKIGKHYSNSCKIDFNLRWFSTLCCTKPIPFCNTGLKHIYLSYLVSL